MSLGTSGSDGEVHVDTFTSSGSLMSATVRATSITPCHTPAKANPTSCGAFPSSQPRPLATQIRFAVVQAYDGPRRLRGEEHPPEVEDVLNEGETAFFFAAQNLGPRAQDLGGLNEEGVSVPGVAHGGRRHGADGCRTRLMSESRVVTQDIERARHRGIVEVARRVDAATEASDHRAALVTDEQARRVRADVDRGDHR